MAAAARLVLVLLAAAAAPGRVAGDCGKPPALTNGTPKDEFLTQSSFAVGATVTYMCHNGYTFAELSSPRVTCLANSTWTALRATCEPKSCGNPGEILNGYYNATGNTFGSKVTFYCDEGYQLVGRNYRLCESDGWSGQVPTCEVVKCPDLPDIANRSISGLGNKQFWEYGMTATFSCLHNLLLVGAKKITCRATGQWSTDPPTCRDPNSIIVSTPAAVSNTTSTPTTTARSNTTSTLNTTVSNTTSTPTTTARSNTTSTLNTTVRRNTTSTPITTLNTDTTSTAGGSVRTSAGHQYILFLILAATIYPVFNYD